MLTKFLLEMGPIRSSAWARPFPGLKKYTVAKDLMGLWISPALEMGLATWAHMSAGFVQPTKFRIGTFQKKKSG